MATKKSPKIPKASPAPKLPKVPKLLSESIDSKSRRPKASKLPTPPVEETKEVKPSLFPKKEGRYTLGVGRRKTSTCLVRLYKGTGEVLVNGKTFEEYFSEPFMMQKILTPLALVGKDKAYDITIKISGGGKNSQAEAVRLGIARALVAEDAELRTTLKHEGFLTRDPRAKERKKYGLKRARKAPQYSKR